MANTFKNSFSKNVGTSPVTVYTAPSSTQTTLIGFSVANVSTSPITCDAYITSSATDYYLIKSGVVPVGGSLSIIGADGKIVLNTGDKFQVVSGTAASADVLVSALLIT
jgi:hypothetical protein